MAEIAAGPAKGKVIEIWFQDEARIGQKNKITRRWAKRGSRPSAPHDQRTRSAYIFGAICPQHGKAAALVMPWCDTHAMKQHLIESRRKHLAVHEGYLAIQPHLQVLRGYRRPLLLRLANTAGAAMEDHVNWPTAMGTRVLINDGWYKNSKIE